MDKKIKWDYVKVGNVSRKNSKFLKGALVLDDIPKEAIQVNEEGKKQVMLSIIPRKDNSILNVSWPSMGWHPSQQCAARSREAATGRNTDMPTRSIGLALDIPELPFEEDSEG